jgi:peptide/histidine transporter 3/4
MANDSSSNESATTALDDILESRITINRQLRGCCKSTYKLRKLKNRGALLVLVWNFLIMSLFYYIMVHTNHDTRVQHYITVGITLPIAGCLADAYLARYRVIRWSIWIMWVGTMLSTISSVVAQLVVGYEIMAKSWIIERVLQAIAAIGYGGYQANIIQFGIDQLHDASTEEIQAYISWYVWSFFSGGIAIDLATSCLQKDYHHITWQLVATASLTIVLSLSFILDNTLVKEPITQNPFKLVYNVIKFAIKNKHPRCRSAFTYCEDELPSRLDLGKHKYGGPFTTEQVEDVKTFLRLLPFVFFGCAMLSALLVVNTLRDNLITALTKVHTPTLQCYINSLYTQAPFYSVVVLIPLNEFIVRPVLYKYFLWVQCYWTFSFGAILQFVRIMLLESYVLIARHNYITQQQHNATIQCIFLKEYHNGTLSSSFDIRWIALQSFLNSISLCALSLGGVEFICAQTPYSMRGLISGAGYGSVILFTLIGVAITQPFMMDLSIWKTGGIINCEFWYLLLVIVFFIFNGIILYILGRVYKNRKREDVLPNEQIFAERYYSQQ